MLVIRCLSHNFLKAFLVDEYFNAFPFAYKKKKEMRDGQQTYARVYMGSLILNTLKRSITLHSSLA